MTRPVLSTLLLATAMACASTGEGTRRDPHRITRAEIEASTRENAYDLVRTLRSQWLTPKAGTSIRAGQGVIRVYVDGRPAQALQDIPRMVIQEIRFYPPTEAQARWGLSHHRGAIDVITRKNGPGG